MKQFITVLLISITLISQAQVVTSLDGFFTSADNFFKKNVSEGLVDYEAIKANPTPLVFLVKYMETADVANKDKATQKAFWINAYNLTTIKAIINKYPINSPLDDEGFFTAEKHKVAGRELTLSDIENKVLKAIDPNPHSHFVLVCAAMGCPRIANFAYTPDKVEEQAEQRTKVVLNDPNFVRVNNSTNTVQLSEIFTWYKGDFTKVAKSPIDYINKYRTTAIPSSYKVSSYTYDWALNRKKKVGSTSAEEELSREYFFPTETTPTEVANGDDGKSIQDYTLSVLYDKKEFEVRLFSNLYTQNASYDSKGVNQPDNFNGRANYFTSFLQFTAGLHPRVNVGLDLEFRSASRNLDRSASAAEVLRFQNNTDHQTKLSSIGPKIKFIPFGSFRNFSVQSTFYIPTARDKEGGDNGRIFLDWDKFNWWTQFFFDQRINNYLNLFYGIDFVARFGGSSEATNLLQTPVTFIVTTFPSKKFTLYALTQYFPTHQRVTWNDNNVFSNQYFIQLGIGTKFIIANKLELEFSYNNFIAGRNAGAGQVYNLGIRYIYR